MADKPAVLRETDENALRQARLLIRSAQTVSLGVIDPNSGFPSVSLALVATDLDCVPVILVSALAAHTRSLAADPRCSLLAQEPGKGDPLAHPRMTVFCHAEAVDRDSEVNHRLRTRFLDRHPKSALYIDFPDFRFFRLVPRSASLNGGFGRAYAIDGAALFLDPPEDMEGWLALQQKIMEEHQDAGQIAAAVGASDLSKCRICGIDPAGFNLICGTKGFRHEFSSLCPTPNSAEYELRIMLKAV